MPDITMCSHQTCALRTKCYRNPASGTTPKRLTQSWFMNMNHIMDDGRERQTFTVCTHYWPIKDDHWRIFE